MIRKDYPACPIAMKILSERWKATLEDLAAWVFLGPDLGGIAAYRNANELNPPPRFYFEHSMGEDYLSPLMACCFRQNDLARFEPADHYINGEALIERWSKQLGPQAEAFICAKIAESRLLDMHPIFGVTQAHFKDIIPPSLIEECIPPLSAGLFAMSEIKQIEAEDGLDVQVLPGADVNDKPVHNGGHKKGGSPKGPLAEAVEMAYLHFRDKGDVAILQSGNIRSFLKSFKSLTDDSQSKEFGNGNVCAYLAERIKEVKIPRAGKCLVTTHDRRDGRKTKHGQDHSQNDISKLLTKLREKLPLPS